MKISIVTGASSGLGREFVYLLDKHENLDEIWVIARRENRLKELQEQSNTKIRVLAYDLTEKESFAKLSELLKEEKPEVAFLINAAGFGKIGSYKDISLEDSGKMIDLNCRAAVAVTQIVIPYMPKKSHILEICSTSAFQPFQFLDIYAATKAFLYRYSRALRVELFPRHISVTAVCPYWIRDTEFISTAKRTHNSSYIRNFPFSSKAKTIAVWAMSDAKLGLPVSTPGPVCILHRISAKFIPHELMMSIWALLRRI
ncbi:MAG: SDR family NAD(P)-dependent oxidoreductase [Clostridia bacterium]|jgi:short-subunit dehydrogenase|nr:SDR family NAD(P)-dependent oxidoreductase [Clostridia bacterium]